MNPVIQFVVATLLVVCTVCLCGILKVLLDILQHLKFHSRHEFGHSDPHCCCHEDHDNPAGYGIYMFREGKWCLQADLSATGFEITAPSIPGRFEGQVIRREAQRSL